MQVDYQTALDYYDKIAGRLKFPSAHPYYIMADSKRSPDLEPAFFVYSEADHVYYHGFHKVSIPGTDFVDLQSAYGYGGPIATHDDKAFIERAWRSFSTWCEQSNVLVEFIRFHPVANNWSWFNGDVFTDRQTVWVDLANPNLFASYKSRAKTAIRKAQKNGLQVEWLDKTAFLDIFPSLYITVMDEIGAEQMYYFNSDYFQEIINWDQALLAVCRLDEEIVAASIFLHDTFMMEYHLSAATQNGKRNNATNLILYEAAELSKQKGLNILHLGGGTDGCEDNPLLFFKQGFSDFAATFKIGKKVHATETYNRMKEDWEMQKGRRADKILFYRF